MKHLKAFKENKSDNNYEMKGKSENFQDFFHDLSDEFNVVYFPIPVQMNDDNNYLESKSSNGAYYISRNTNKINIKVAFKNSYIRENIRSFVEYLRELKGRLEEFTWETVVDNRFAGAKSVYYVTNRIDRKSVV